MGGLGGFVVFSCGGPAVDVRVSISPFKQGSFPSSQQVGEEKEERGKKEDYTLAEDNGTWAHISDFLHTAVCKGPD
jgi:hypothetical protein